MEKFKNIFKTAFGSLILDALEVIVIALGLFIVIYLFIASPHVVVGTSMEPNFTNGEFLLTDNLSYRFSNPQRGDVIVLQYNANSEFIKRVIGLPGDKISVSGGRVYINGIELNESAYLPKGVVTTGGPFLQDGQVKTVPANDYFVLGDNRAVSEDSRYFGWVPKNTIKGKVFFIYFPLSKLSIVHGIKYIKESGILDSKVS